MVARGQRAGGGKGGGGGAGDCGSGEDLWRRHVAAAAATASDGTFATVVALQILLQPKLEARVVRQARVVKGVGWRQQRYSSQPQRLKSSCAEYQGSSVCGAEAHGGAGGSGAGSSLECSGAGVMWQLTSLALSKHV